MRIAFITDPHIGLPDETPQGVDVRQNFLNALAALPDLKPDCVILGGDLCSTTGNRLIYEWVKNQMDTLPIPYYVVAGNHDDSTMLADVFQKTHDVHEGELYYALPLNGRPVLFLDTARGKMSDTQWTWLHDHLTALRDDSVLIVMHHPPLPADVPFMDANYAFQQPDEFLSLLQELPCHITVVCGHYHVEKVVQRGNLLVLLSPSTFYQMSQNTTEFAINHYRVGIREINITMYGINSCVYYL